MRARALHLRPEDEARTLLREHGLEAHAGADIEQQLVLLDRVLLATVPQLEAAADVARTTAQRARSLRAALFHPERP